MKPNSFSFRRFALLARIHYVENRQNYLYGIGIYALFMAYSIWRALDPDNPSMNAFEASTLFVSFCTPVLVAKHSFSAYYQPGKQIEALTLPATQGEKFLFVTLNTLLLSTLVIATFEIAASLVAPTLLAKGDVSIYQSAIIVGHWFRGLDEFIPIALLLLGSSVLACTMARKGNVGKPMLLIWSLVALLHLLPVILFHNGLGTSTGEINIPHFTATLEHLFTVGGTQIEFHTERLLWPQVWHTLIVPTILLIAAWFRFSEYETK